jgi:hypothetical protein
VGRRRGRHFTFEAQQLGCATECCNIFAVLALDDRVDRCGRILVRMGRCFQGLVDFVDPRIDVIGDRLFRRSNVARRFVAPTDGVSKLLFMIAHCLRAGLDPSPSGASPSPRPDMGPVKNGCLVTSPSVERAIKCG